MHYSFLIRHKHVQSRSNTSDSKHDMLILLTKTCISYILDSNHASYNISTAQWLASCLIDGPMTRLRWMGTEGTLLWISR